MDPKELPRTQAVNGLATNIKVDEHVVVFSESKSEAALNLHAKLSSFCKFVRVSGVGEFEHLLLFAIHTALGVGAWIM